MILVFLSFIAAAAANPWQDLAKKDLTYIVDAIQKDHPGPVDKENPNFGVWLKKGKKETEALIKKVNNLEGYRFALQYYLEGYNDGHLNFWTNYDYDDNRWPGFILALRGGKYVVYESEKKLPVGSELIACDGKTPTELMAKNIYPFDGQPMPESRNYGLVPLLLVDRGNPFIELPKSCKFKSPAGETDTMALNWEGIGFSRLKEKLSAAAFGPRPEFAVREFKPGHYWFTFPTFGPREDQLKTMNEQIAKVGELKKKAKVMVFDVRGNSGGSSEFGKRIFTALYGEKAEEAVNHKNYDPVFIEWRASKRNLEKIKTWPAEFSKRFGEKSDMIGWAKDLGNQFETAVARKQALFREKDDEVKPPFTGELPPLEFQGKVFFLTDGRCGSACLDFSDYMLGVPQTIHVGGETAADTTYMEGNIINPLPSQIGALFYPMKVWRGRARGNGQSYKPKHVWEKDLGDTAALEKWILTL
jgi:hypothetical protein